MFLVYLSVHRLICFCFWFICWYTSLFVYVSGWSVCTQVYLFLFLVFLLIHRFICLCFWFTCLYTGLSASNFPKGPEKKASGFAGGSLKMVVHKWLTGSLMAFESTERKSTPVSWPWTSHQGLISVTWSQWINWRQMLLCFILCKNFFCFIFCDAFVFCLVFVFLFYFLYLSL